MAVLRRNLGQASDSGRGRSGSTIWEDEADEYWKKMEPTKQCRRLTTYFGRFVAIVLICGGVFFGARVALDHDSITRLKTRFIDVIADAQKNVSNANEAFTTTSKSMEEIQVTTKLEVSSTKMDQEILRGSCRVRGVQSSWHQEMCRKLCTRDPHNAACMNGCSYGSLTMTKVVCDKMEATEAASASRCPDGVSCLEACRAYDDQLPFPDLRNSCVRGCSNIVPSACARSLQIYRDLIQNMP
ncbi:hypothetical protein Plhal304r1_c034g0106671 [Plasmopara halstedii]